MDNDINLHIVLVQAWIRNGDKYLMAQRSSKDTQNPGGWAIPGGKCDNELGDSIIEETLRREIKEEVGLEITNNLKYVGSQAFTRSSGHHVVSIAFIAEYLSGVAQPLEDQDAVKWMTIDEIKELINSEGGPKWYAPHLTALEAEIK